MILPDGWLSDAEAEALQRLAADNLVLEVGSWKGRSTVALSRSARLVWAVDWFCGDDGTGKLDTLSAFRDNLRAFGVDGKVVVCVGSFADVLPILGVDAFGLIFLDADHSYYMTRRLLDAIVPRCSLGKLIAVHDWSIEYPDVVNAVNDCGRLRMERCIESLGVFRVGGFSN